MRALIDQVIPTLLFFALAIILGLMFALALLGV